MSQPLRSAYICIVIAVQEASAAASSSSGAGPTSRPPMSSGSSATSRWSRTRTSCSYLPLRMAIARMTSRLPRIQRVEEQAGQDLGEEVRRLRRHDLAGRCDVADALHRGSPHEEAGLHLAVEDAPAGLLGRARVVQAPEVGDVVLAHAEGAREHERLEDRRVEVAVGLRAPRQGGVDDGLVLQPEAQGAPVAGVQVPELDGLAGACGLRLQVL